MRKNKRKTNRVHVQITLSLDLAEGDTQPSSLEIGDRIAEFLNALEDIPGDNYRFEFVSVSEARPLI